MIPRVHYQSQAPTGLHLGAETQTAQLRLIGLDKPIDPMITRGADSRSLDPDGIALIH